MNIIYIYTYLKWHICTQCAAIVKIKRHPLLLGTSLVCQFGTKRSNMASFESAWLGFGPHDIEVPNLHTYIYIWICKENERNLHRAFKGLGKGFPHLPAVSMVYILDTWHPAQPPVPGPTWPHGYFWGPQSGRIHPFFQAPTRWFIYIYIYNRYLCHCVICISTTCLVKSGGPIPQTNTYPSEDHGI